MLKEKFGKQKAPILEVIDSSQSNGVLVWQHPAQDFNTQSVLVVDESQVALLYKNGQIADVFDEAGRYVLSTQNIPLLRKIIQIPTGGVSTFKCKVYFINMVEAMNIKWGLNSKVSYVDPIHNIPVKIGLRGVMSISIANPREIVVNLVGTGVELTTEGLIQYFRSKITEQVKSYVVRTISESKINIFEIDGHLDLFAEELKQRIAPTLLGYGINLKMFTIDEVTPDEDAIFIRVKRALSERYTGVFDAETKRQQAIIAADASAQVEAIKARGHAEALNVQGTSYREERQLDISEKMASNPNMNQFSGLAGSMAMMSGAMAMGTQAATAMYGAAALPPNSYSMPPVSPAPNPPLEEGRYENNQKPEPVEEKKESPTENQQQNRNVVSCVGCGKELSAGDAFCRYCGKQQSKVCPKCGISMTAEASFCMKCGNSL